MDGVLTYNSKLEPTVVKWSPNGMIYEYCLLTYFLKLKCIFIICFRLAPEQNGAQFQFLNIFCKMSKEFSVNHVYKAKQGPDLIELRLTNWKGGVGPLNHQSICEWVS